MNKAPTNVIFIWHMHQPWYKHPDKNYYMLPWVRFHAVKDYYGMAKTIERFEKVKAVFNFSGVLVDQLADYANNGAKDYYGMLTLRKPENFNHQEKQFVIDRFFSINFDRHIKSNPRFLQLYNKKVSGKPQFSNQDISDLMAIYNLSWFHPYTVDHDKHLRHLVVKNKNYTQDDREYIMEKQYKVIQSIAPLYAKLVKDNRIELTLTPFHHPIMPLVYDSDVVKEFSYLKRPHLRFQRPQDCVWHLKKSQEVFGKFFGHVPTGSWPSEGSVSEDVVSLYAKEGFKWIGADEAILFKSLTNEYVTYDMIKNQRHLIYRPYNFSGVNMFFRDRNLSDLIGFTYGGWNDSVFAAADLVEHFKRVHSGIKNTFKKRAITIIMDGENAWEYYYNNGVDFLEAMYRNLESSDCLHTTTPSQYLNQNHEDKHLERLASGSWINGDFGVWVGSQTNNAYWHTLRRIKDELESAKGISDNKIQEAWDYLHLLEGSDWFWWNTFSDPNGDFRNIFTSYVNKIYLLLGKEAPKV